jgi:succinate dehydrogenase / fumarate reductase cytochrome b subunit
MRDQICGEHTIWKETIMGTLITFYNSSVGQKILAGLTGLFLCTFLVVHLSGNFLLFKNDGGKAFGTYSEFMSTNTGIRILEIGLALGFLAHIILGVITWISNRMARPARYAVNRAGENSELSSRVMFITGSTIFIFLVVHLRSFFVPTRFPGAIQPNMFELVKSAFQNPYYDGFYIIALILLGFHLRHGFQSAFQTFGLRPGYNRLIDLVAIVFWLLIPIGYATMPLYFLWAYLKGVN